MQQILNYLIRELIQHKLQYHFPSVNYSISLGNAHIISSVQKEVLVLGGWQYLSCPHNVWALFALQVFTRGSSGRTCGGYIRPSEAEKPYDEEWTEMGKK